MRELDLTPEEFRALAARAVEASEAYLAGLDARPIAPGVSGSELVNRLGAPIPEEGMGPEAFDGLAEVGELGRATNARFFGYVLGSGEPVGALGDLYASVLNQNVTAWRSSPAAVTVEKAVVESLARAVGCDGFHGSLTSGGSLANLMGLAMARERAPGVVYASTEIHMSIPKALALLGSPSLRVVPMDDAFRISVDALREAIADDRAAGRTPSAIVASAGTIVTGAVDPLAAVAEVARENDLWLHVDGAYGAFAALAVPDLFAGLGLADSVSLDAHKWLYQPVDCSLFLYRDAETARRVFSYSDDYARVLNDDPVEGFAFFEESFELSRRFRALKLWLSLRYHGLGAFRESIRADLGHARLLADLVEAEPSLELVAPVELSAVCFRVRDADNAEVLRRVNAGGRVYLSNATIRGEFALRACFVNHRTTEDDVRAIVEEVTTAA